MCGTHTLQVNCSNKNTKFLVKEIPKIALLQMSSDWLCAVCCALWHLIFMLSLETLKKFNVTSYIHNESAKIIRFGVTSKWMIFMKREQTFQNDN